MARIRLAAFSAFLASVLGGIVAAWVAFSFLAFIGPPNDRVNIAVWVFRAFPLVFYVSGPVSVLGLLFFVVPITSLFADYRTSPRFAFLLACWAALVGWGIIGMVVHSYGHFFSFIFGAWCGGVSALWWLTSRRRWKTMLVSGLPVTSFSADYPSSPRFALHVVFWATLIGLYIIFRNGNVWLATYCAGCVAVIALWWSLTFGWRWEKTSEQPPPTSPP